LGIPQNLKESIYCLSGSPSKRTFNFGIGLAGVKKLLDRSGGKIWHEPNLDTEGTCFYFELPELDNNFNI
jgi:signal transduction histidine kinase